MKKNLKKFILIGVTGITILFNTGCASCERIGKNLSSEFNNGLNRSVYVYDMTGNLIKTYKGKIDIEETEAENKVKFDITDNQNQRIMIYNAIVIVEEEIGGEKFEGSE